MKFHVNVESGIHLHGGVDRMRANVAVSQAAYAEASEPMIRDCAGIAAARMVLAQVAEKEKRKSQRVELSVD